MGHLKLNQLYWDIFMVDAHEALITLGIKLGYTQNDEGLCHGLTIRWLEACLLDEQDKFITRINKIIETKHLGEQIQKAQDKRKKHETLTTDDLENLDILPFYDSLILYHHPDVHHQIFNQALGQTDIAPISQLAASDAIQAQGELSSIYSEPNIYTENEIKDYLNEIQTMMMNNEINPNKKNCFMTLSSPGHSIGLFYQPGDEAWTFMDINQWPPSDISSLNSTDEISEAIMLAFEESPYIAFNTTIAITDIEKKHSQALITQLDKFKKSHPITSEKAGRMAGDINLAYVAALHGHADVIAELARYGVDLNQLTPNGKSLIDIAKARGHERVVVELEKYSTTPPDFIAAKAKHAKTIAALRNETPPNGPPPIKSSGGGR